jgi:hypothetical protein
MSHGFRSLALCSAVALAAPLAAHAQAPSQAAGGPAAVYHVSDIIVGSIVPQVIVTGPVPFESSYASLTAAQKAVLNQDYESLAAGDEPPYPLYGVRHLIMPLISYAETYSPIGPLVASVEVDSKGNAIAVKVYRSPDPEMSRLLSGAMAFEKYKPASCKGQPCRMEYVLRVNFPDRHGMPVQELAFHHYDQNTANFSWR